ncbi:MAG: response regulator [Promethearchaeota archaeon]
MKELLLIVEDNEDVLYNLKITLEFNNYRVLTAENGVKGLETLSRLENLPDLIVSDIMMPEMDGYDFFKAVSENPLWNRIPFIFLTARSSPNDIRFGKMLGVDDYISKPFKEEDLLASIAGKITRNKKIKDVNRKIGNLLSSLTMNTPLLITSEEKSSIIILYVVWNDKTGPTLKAYYPLNPQIPFDIHRIGFQLFNGVVSIYGQTKIHEAQGILLTVENIKKQGYIYFDSIADSMARGREIPFMLGILASRINYFESLKIKEIFKNFSLQIKENEPWDIEHYWMEIINALKTVP